MTGTDAPRKDYGTTPVEIQVLLSQLAAVVLVAAVALVVFAIDSRNPPRPVLTGTTWQWTGSATAEGASEIVVPDPSAYTIEFSRDRTFEAVADCELLAGTYRTIPAGRQGGAANTLAILPDDGGPPSCGQASLAAEFVAELEVAGSYRISGSQLTITRTDDGTMTFDAAPTPSPSPGA